MKNWKDRQGVWVETDQGVGVRTIEKTRLEGAVPVEISVGYVDMVNGAGETIAARVPELSLGNVRIARAAAIPSARIAHLPPATLQQLGYV